MPRADDHQDDQQRRQGDKPNYGNYKRFSKTHGPSVVWATHIEAPENVEEEPEPL